MGEDGAFEVEIARIIRDRRSGSSMIELVLSSYLQQDSCSSEVQNRVAKKSNATIQQKFKNSGRKRKRNNYSKENC